MEKALFIMRAAIEQLEHAPKAQLDLNKLKRLPHGAVVFNVKPMRSGDYDYLAIEVNAKIPGVNDWDDVVTGRIERSEVERILDQFEALPVTNDHYFINTKNSTDASGRVLKAGKMEKDGHVLSRLVIEDSELITEIESGQKIEVSIGFYADKPTIVENKKKNDPHFYIRNIELNHLAIVKKGRAGKKARLYHDGQLLLSQSFQNNLPEFEFNQPTEVTMKIKIGNQSFDLEENVVEAINQDRQQTQDQLSNVQNTLNEANQNVSTLRGENASLTKQVEESENVHDEAKRLLAEHNDLVKKLNTLGSKQELVFGEYDATEILRSALKECGVTGLENSTYESLCHTYNGYVAANGKKTNRGELESTHANPQRITHSKRLDRGRSRVEGKIHNLFFKPTKQEAE